MKLSNWAIWVKGDDENGITQRVRLDPSVLVSKKELLEKDGETKISLMEEKPGKELK